MSVNSLNIEQIKKLPALFGEPDIIKNVQMQPGVVAVGEGTSGYFVRGGTADQNLILIDEAPIFDPSHFFGLFSVFNADVIKDSKLIKGGIPARMVAVCLLYSISEQRTAIPRSWPGQVIRSAGQQTYVGRADKKGREFVPHLREKVLC